MELNAGMGDAAVISTVITLECGGCPELHRCTIMMMIMGRADVDADSVVVGGCSKWCGIGP